jgi:hypothetical protein
VKRVFLLSTLVVFVLVPCAAYAGTSHTVDLSTGLVDGHRVLGRTVAGVTASLGRPDFRVVSQSRYRIGWGRPDDVSVEVLFRRSGGGQRASSIVFERGQIHDVRAGSLLGRTPEALQKTIVAGYGDTLRLERSYHCTAGRCVGEFVPRPDHSLHVTFGSRPVFGTWVTLWQAST